MAALFTLTVNSFTPPIERRDQELQKIARALDIARVAVQSRNANGTITDDFGQVLGTWTYTPQAAS
jgi:hypothetical protein